MTVAWHDMRSRDYYPTLKMAWGLYVAGLVAAVSPMIALQFGVRYPTLPIISSVAALWCYSEGKKQSEIAARIEDREGRLDAVMVKADVKQIARSYGLLTDEQKAIEGTTIETKALPADPVGRSLVMALNSFGVSAQFIESVAASSFIRCKLLPGEGVPAGKILKMGPDLQIQMGLEVEPVIGVGIGSITVDMPRVDRQVVRFADVVKPGILPNTSPLAVAIGVDLEGKLIEADLSDPNTCHFLIGGTTGGGKSELIRSMLHSLTDRYSPNRVQLALLDPKRVTYNEYNDSPYLYRPIAKSVDAGLGVLEKLNEVMEERYLLCEEAGVVDLDSYIRVTGNILPHIIVGFDEFAFFIDKDKLGFETKIVDLARMARAAGVHLLMGTQRPDAQICTPQIRSNLPARIALKTATTQDSAIVLGGDDKSAVQLLGKGDMWFLAGGRKQRLQAPLFEV